MAPLNEKQTLSALAPEVMADLLRKSGSGTATAAAIQRMVGEGAPVNPDETIHLIRFTAWLVKRYSQGK